MGGKESSEPRLGRKTQNANSLPCVPTQQPPPKPTQASPSYAPSPLQHPPTQIPAAGARTWILKGSPFPQGTGQGLGVQVGTTAGLVPAWAGMKGKRG